MYLSGYSVRVTGGREHDAYVELDHMQTYTLVLRNHQERACDATVYLDGVAVGTWRIPAHNFIALERPAHDRGRFTFVRAGTPEARQAQLPDNQDLGLVRVDFIPVEAVGHYVRPTAFISDPPPYYIYNDVPPGAVTYSATTSASTLRGAEGAFLSTTNTTNATNATNVTREGGTGLSGHSAQEFVAAESLARDYANMVTIHLRLVMREDNAVRPLVHRSNPIPPRLG
jgi:hypothetical protein